MFTLWSWFYVIYFCKFTTVVLITYSRLIMKFSSFCDKDHPQRERERERERDQWPVKRISSGMAIIGQSSFPFH